MRAAVVGLGKLGLPLAAQLSMRGIPTVGSDVDSRVVRLVNEGSPPFPGEQGLARMLSDLVSRKLLRATTDTAAAVADADVAVVVVPLIVDATGRPSFEAIDSATQDVARGLSRGHLVIYETTLPVGTTRSRFGPLLSSISGLVPGSDFHLAFSPERVYTGRVFDDLRRYPKLVGGIDEASTKAAIDFYERAIEFDERSDLIRPNGVWDLGSTEAAELTKLTETTYRDVNIALANEFAAYAEDLGIDIGTVIEAANSQPFSHIHNPGLVGGHCIPVYPHLYLYGHSEARLPAVGRSVNEAVAARILDRIEHETGSISRRYVVVLGASYRGNVKETAFSGVFALVEQIQARGGRTGVHDPLYTDDELVELGLTPHRLGEPCFAAILHADHSLYRNLSAEQLPGCKVLFDVRRIVPEELSNNLKLMRLGVGERGKKLH